MPNSDSPTSVRFIDVGKLLLGHVEFLQGLLHGIGGTGGEKAHLLSDGGKGDADDLQVFVENLGVGRD